MDWSAVMELIDPRLIVVVFGCWAVGITLKRTPFVPDWSIVYLVTLIGSVLAVWQLGMTPEAMIQGILCGAVAVYGHQVVKQTRNRGGDPQ